MVFNTIRLACYWLCTVGPLCNGLRCAITVCNRVTLYVCVSALGVSLFLTCVHVRAQIYWEEASLEVCGIIS